MSGDGAAANSLRDVRAEVEALLAESSFAGGSGGGGGGADPIQPLGTAPHAAPVVGSLDDNPLSTVPKYAFGAAGPTPAVELALSTTLCCSQNTSW
jgi:hypothetical protein